MSSWQLGGSLKFRDLKYVWELPSHIYDIEAIGLIKVTQGTNVGKENVWEQFTVKRLENGEFFKTRWMKNSQWDRKIRNPGNPFIHLISGSRKWSAVRCCWSAEQIEDRLSHKICNVEDQFSDKWPSVNWSFVVPCSNEFHFLRNGWNTTKTFFGRFTFSLWLIISMWKKGKV